MMKMKRIALMAMMMMAVLSASAQYDAGTWSLGLRGGFSASQQTNLGSIPNYPTATTDSKWQGGGYWGLDLDFQAAKCLAIGLGLHRSWEGGAWKDFTVDNVDYEEANVDMTYLKLPLTANFYVVKGLALKAGVQVGLLTSAEISVKSVSRLEGRKLTTKESLNIKDDCNKIDISIPVGIYYETKGHFIFGAHYDIGLTKVNKNNDLFDKDIKNGVFAIDFGFKFSL